MTEFNLTILSTLQEKFNELKIQINEKNISIQTKEEKLQNLKKQIEELESKILNIEIDLGEDKKEIIRLEEIYNTTNIQCSQIQETASKILSQF